MIPPLTRRCVTRPGGRQDTFDDRRCLLQRAKLLPHQGLRAATQVNSPGWLSEAARHETVKFVLIVDHDRGFSLQQ